MKKTFLMLVCTALIGAFVVSCGNKKAGDNNNEVATEQVVEEGSAEANAAIAEAEAIFNEVLEVSKKAEAKEITSEQALGAILELASKDAKWDKKYKKLTESDYTPAQWQHLQEMKAKVKELMSK
ncbi:MAG: hypothetical protein IK041_04000 [Bacteroidales bacterium]|nr:hypothetical protein [Bacteroidales bacterium]